MDSLTPEEIDIVNGGISNDTAYSASLGSAGGFLAVGLAGAALFTPVGVGILLGASIFSSGMAIHYALQ